MVSLMKQSFLVPAGGEFMIKHWAASAGDVGRPGHERFSLSSVRSGRHFRGEHRATINPRSG
jgi:hypothetical protein